MPLLLLTVQEKNMRNCGMFEGSEARAVRVVVGGRIITLGTGSPPTYHSLLAAADKS